MKKKITIILLVFCLLITGELKSQPQFDDEVEDTPIHSITGILGLSAVYLGLLKKKKEED